VEVGEQPEAVGPRVGRPHPPAEVGERGDPPAAADAAGEHDVRLHDVDAAAQHEVARLGEAPHHLARSEPQRRRRPQPRVALHVAGRQRLLEPVHAERLERAGARDRLRDVPRPRAVAGHPPAVVGVDHDLHRRADRLAHRRDDRDVVAPVRVVEAELDRAHPRGTQRDHPPRALLGDDELAARRVGQDPLAAAAEEAPQRLARQPRREVPDRDLRAPRPPVVQVDGLAQLAHHLGPPRVQPDEQPLQQRRVGQVVAARVARRAVLGADDDEAGLHAAARLRVPGRAERRIEVEPVAPDLERGDPHQPPV